MLLANREVSKKVVSERRKKDEFIFRIHDEPSTDDMDRFVSIVGLLVVTYGEIHRQENNLASSDIASRFCGHIHFGNLWAW